jgi:hypothetical protein
MATVLHRYYTLASVLEARPQGMGFRIWAGDRVNANGGNTKSFITCTVKDFHRLLHDGKFDVYNWYEVIQHFVLASRQHIRIDELQLVYHSIVEALM